MKQDDQERPAQFNCVANPLKETVTLNLDFIKEMMMLVGVIYIDDAITSFTEKLRFDKDIKSLDSYIKVLESELLFQQTVTELQKLNDADSSEPKVVGKINLPPKQEDIF